MRIKKDSSNYNDDYQVYLDRIYSSPHTPKPSGGLGYTSKKTLPSLEHTGIYSSFDPKPFNITDSFGRLTKEYKWNSCIATAKVEKQNVKVKYTQPFFTSNHRDFLNKVLCDMEDSRSFKIERNRRRWMEGKSEKGFDSQFTSYENALAFEEQRMSSNTPLGYKFGASIGNESTETGAFLTSESFVELPSVEYDKTVTFSLENEDSLFPEGSQENNNKYNSTRPTTTTSTISNNSRPNTSISNLSSRSAKSRPSTTFTGDARRKRNATNRMSLFECLLETTEPPTSPIKRYGSFSPWSERTITTASSLDSRGSELVQEGLKKWSETSIKRANTGDRPRKKNKDYR